MSTTVALLLESALLGTLIGLRYSIAAMLGWAPIVATVAVLGLLEAELELPVRLAFAYGCVVVSEAAYFAGAWVRFLRADALPTWSTST